MINFRYHIVSLMAVFMAMAVGIAVGVSLGPSVDQGLLDQAAQDRKQVSDLRGELSRVKALNDYREAYALRVGQAAASGVLDTVRVAVVAMPDAPSSVIRSVSTAVESAGGTVVREVRVSETAFDPTKAEAVATVLSPYAGPLQLDDAMSQATRVGVALGRAVATADVVERDALAVEIGDALDGGGVAAISGDSTAQAQLVIVVTARGVTPAPAPEVLAAHLQLDIALRAAASVVLAGPNSEGLDGTDVLAARSDAIAANVLSTVDVADLSSGVTTTVLAAKEQLLGRSGHHYGALAKAEAPAPQLPVR